MFDRQGGARVVFEIAFALKPEARFRFHEVDRRTEMVTDDGVHRRPDVDAAIWVLRCHEPMAVGTEQFERPILGKPHRCTLRSVDCWHDLLLQRLRSSSVFDTGTSANGGHSSGIVIPASLTLEVVGDLLRGADQQVAQLAVAASGRSARR